MLIYCLCDKSPALSGRRSPSGSSWVRSICRFSCGLRDLQAGLLMQPGASVSIEVSSYSLSLISSSTSFFSSLLCLTFTFLLPSISSFSFLLSLFSAYTFLSSPIYLILFLSQISRKFSCRSPSSPLTAYSSPPVSCGYLPPTLFPLVISCRSFTHLLVSSVSCHKCFSPSSPTFSNLIRRHELMFMQISFKGHANAYFKGDWGHTRKRHIYQARLKISGDYPSYFQFSRVFIRLKC